jgi:hypothetical protein
MASVFHSLTQAQLLSLLNAGNIVVGDIYYAQDVQTVYIACNTTANGVGIAPTHMLLSGGITLGFNGTLELPDGAPVVGIPNDGDVLTWNATAGAWEPTAVTVPPLGGLTDADTVVSL